MEIEFNGEIWLYDGPGPWHFVTLPEAESRDLKAIAVGASPGRGTISVRVRIARTAWKTSLFPNGDRYDLPIKAAVGLAEKLAAGDLVTVRIAVV